MRHTRQQTFSKAWCTKLPNTSILMSIEAKTLFSGGAMSDRRLCTPSRCSRAAMLKGSGEEQKGSPGTLLREGSRWLRKL